MKKHLSAAAAAPAASTIRQFCESNNISIATYYKIAKLGAGPREMRLPGNLIRISTEAEAEWRAARENPSAEEAAALAREAERRRERSRKAAKKAVESPLHVSRRAAEVA
jgi:hypothetical protein